MTRIVSGLGGLFGGAPRTGCHLVIDCPNCRLMVTICEAKCAICGADADTGRDRDSLRCKEHRDFVTPHTLANEYSYFVCRQCSLRDNPALWRFYGYLPITIEQNDVMVQCHACNAKTRVMSNPVCNIYGKPATGVVYLGWIGKRVVLRCTTHATPTFRNWCMQKNADGPFRVAVWGLGFFAVGALGVVGAIVSRTSAGPHPIVVPSRIVASVDLLTCLVALNRCEEKRRE
jgi:hypothetical protein